MNPSIHFRSISLESRSHPATLQIEEELRELGKSMPLISSNGLCRLVELYKSMDDLLNLPQTLQALSKHQNEKWVDGLLEGPVKLLDICSFTRDFVSQSIDHVRDIQFCLRRRRKGDLISVETAITKYISFKRKMKKDCTRLITSLIKKMDQNVDDQSAVIKVVREVNAMSISIFQSLIVFLCGSKSKRSKWSFSRLIHKGPVSCEGEQNNTIELESMHIISIDDAENIQCLKNKLNNLEAFFENIETGLESMFRCLLKFRISLLNGLSC